MKGEERAFLRENMSLLAEKVVELGIDAGLKFAQQYFRDEEVRRRYIRIVEDTLKNQEKQFEKSTLEEEFDFKGIVDFLKRPTTIEYVKIAITGTQSERKKARGVLYNQSIEFSQAETKESKGIVRKLVSIILESLKQIERDNMSFEKRMAMAEIVDEVNSHIDEKMESVLDRINSIMKTENDYLHTDSKKYPNIRSAMLANGGEKVDSGGVLFSVEKINKEILGYGDEPELQFMREQLGNRLSGNETNDEVATLFWAETKMTWQSGKRYEVMPMMKSLVRDVCKASIYSEDLRKVVDRVQMAHFYWDNYDIFQLNGDRYIIRVLLCNNDFNAISMGYSFGDLADVNDRLFYFEKIKLILEAKSIIIAGCGKEKYSIRLEMSELGDEWSKKWELTWYWINQMEKISEIESHYGIKFKLPNKATEDDYDAIEVLSDSIHRKTCGKIAGIPGTVFEGMELDTNICIDKVSSIGCPENLEEILLFGYTFVPKDEYIMPCTLYLNDNNIFETVEGGIPVGFEFALK